MTYQEIPLVIGSKIISDPNLRGLVENTPCELAPDSKTYSESLAIHWVIPDFRPGTGGHMTIFRMIRYLESFGHTNTIWIYNQTFNKTPGIAYDGIVRHFQLLKATVCFTSDESFKNVSGDVVVATNWGSVSFVNSLENFKRRFYFVQDNEPQFKPRGSFSISAENTYLYDIDCICAGPWLRDLMKNRYGRWARKFWLAADFETYNCYGRKIKKNKHCARIAFYTRIMTHRRAVELGFLALEELAEQELDIEVHLFGAPALGFNEAPFKCIDHGIMTTTDLAQLYRECDIGIVFSTTNYSLIPQEMMACGLPVIELDTESTRAIFPDDVITLVSNKPKYMAEQIRNFIADPARRTIQAEKALQWVSQFSWYDAARSVENAFFERLEEVGFKKETLSENKSVKASVIIPTYNGSQVFKKVFCKVREQIAPWKYEICIVDSGSTDGTAEFLESQDNIIFHRIPNSEFQHGRTRNFAINLTSGEFIAVLTQDALPVSEYWLYNMVTAMEKYPNAAGAFGKHLAWPDADPFTKRDMANHFRKFDEGQFLVSRDTNPDKWQKADRYWKQYRNFSITQGNSEC